MYLYLLNIIKIAYRLGMARWEDKEFFKENIRKCVFLSLGVLEFRLDIDKCENWPSRVVLVSGSMVVKLGNKNTLRAASVCAPCPRLPLQRDFHREGKQQPAISSSASPNALVHHGSYCMAVGRGRNIRLQSQSLSCASTLSFPSSPLCGSYCLLVPMYQGGWILSLS